RNICGQENVRQENVRQENVRQENVRRGMLTKDLLRYRIDAGQISPAFLEPGSQRYTQAARELIMLFSEHLGKTLGELEEAIEKYVAGRTDYRILRGLAKVLMSFTELESRRSDASTIRGDVFEHAAINWPVVRRSLTPLDTDRHSILEEVAGRA